MSNTKMITGLGDVELLTRSNGPQAVPAETTESGVWPRLRKVLAVAITGRLAAKHAASDEDNAEWEEWMHGGGRAGR